MKKIRLAPALLSLALVLLSFSASAFIVQDKDGTWLDCNWITNSAGESRLQCEPLVSQPPDPNP
ncbi:hypothetical protein [Lysobacter sp. Root690]|uniref:hypothetical protein n=1 Tax=Lysobacter sp. Root690 TaxID=1736588 RepID=UPI0006F9185A|nr:hypothetical protein [Lysobacter sp. Root690]KRB06936.1 hypothetical protein ASD86_13150 [Lysobacter sp. Root690]